MALSIPECDISVSKLLGFETFPFFWIVLDSVSKKIDIKKRYQFGIGKIWHRKKNRIRYRKIFGIKKYQIWYRKIFGIKKYRIWYRKYLVSEKVSDSVSFRFLVSSHTGGWVWCSSGFGFTVCQYMGCFWDPTYIHYTIMIIIWSCWDPAVNSIRLSSDTNLVISTLSISPIHKSHHLISPTPPSHIYNIKSSSIFSSCVRM